MQHYSDQLHVNVGTGEDIAIADLASIIKEIVGFDGNIVYDSTKPDGTPRKLLDVSLLQNLGFHYKTDLRTGISKVYQWYLNNETEVKK